MPDPILENKNEEALAKKKRKRVSNSYTENYPALTKMAWGFDPSLTPASNEVATHLGNIGSAIYGGAKGLVGTAAGALGEIAATPLGATDHLGITDGWYDNARAGLNSIWGDVGNSLRDVARPVGGSAIFGGKGIYEGSNNAARMKKHTEDMWNQGITGKIGAGLANTGDWGGAIAANALPLALASPALATAAIAAPAATQATALGTDIYQGHKKDALIQEQWPDAFKRLKAKLIKDNPTATPAQISDAIAAYEKQRKDSGLMPKEFVDGLVDDEAGDGAGIFNKITDTLGDWGQSGASALGAGDWYKKLSPTAQAAIPALLGAGGLGLGGYALYKMLAGDDDKEEEEEDEEEQRRQALQEYYNQYYKQSADSYPALTKEAILSDEERNERWRDMLPFTGNMAPRVGDLEDKFRYSNPEWEKQDDLLWDKYLKADERVKHMKKRIRKAGERGQMYMPRERKQLDRAKRSLERASDAHSALEFSPFFTAKEEKAVADMIKDRKAQSFALRNPFLTGLPTLMIWPEIAEMRADRAIQEQMADKFKRLKLGSAYPALTKSAFDYRDYVPDSLKRKAFEGDPGSYIAPELQKIVAPPAATVANVTGVQGVNTAANAAAQSVGRRAGAVYKGQPQQNKDIAWKAFQKDLTPTEAAGEYAQNAMNNPGQAASDVGNAAKDFVWGQ